MAEIILSVIANGVLGTITSLIISEISLAWGTKNELRKLQMTLSTIKAVLMDAEAQQAKNHEVRDWLEKLKDVVCDVEDVLDEFSTEALRRKMEVKGSMLKEIGNFLSRSNSIVYHFKFGQKIKEIRERLDDIAADRIKFHFKEHILDMRVENRAKEQTYSFVRVSDVIGRENDTENIVKYLLSSSVGDSLSVIPLVGLGGLGKTTLAQLAYNDDRIVGHFEIKMWVCVSVEFDMKKIVEMILKCTSNVKYRNLELDQMISCLRDNLHTKRFLLVLDDVWNEDKTKWTKLKSLLMNGVSGSKIIVTTRIMQVAMIMGTFPPYKLQGLSDDECLSILLRCAFEEGHEQEHPMLIEIGKAIVRKCGGIPLAVVTLGCMLYMKIDEREWFDVRDNEIWTFQQKENDILPALRISYEQLPSHLKQCFSYCSIFPKEYIFAKRELINFWLAHGLLQSLDSNCRFEDIGSRYLNELLSRIFFQDSVLNYTNSTIYTCQRHDLVHDLARMVASTECLDVNSNTKMISERVRHVSFTWTALSNNEFPRSLVNAKNLRSFRLAYTVEHINKAFLYKLISSFRCLRVLDLTGCSKLEELPDIVGNLKHLRILSLCNNPSITKLPNSICKLLNLQTLYLHDCEQLQDLPKNFGKLISLRYLSFTSKLISLPEKGLQGLTSLQVLWLNKCNHLVSLSDGVRYLTSLRELYIYECPSLASLPSGMKYLHALEKLLFWNCQELNLLEGEDMQGLRSLQTLSIIGLPKLQALPKGLLQSASTLQHFSIDNCLGLTTLPEWIQTLTSLRVLYIKNCHNLMFLPVGIHQLTNLQQLSIIGSPHLIKRCTKENGEDWPKISHVPQIIYT